MPAANSRWIFERIGIDPNVESVDDAEVDRLIGLLGDLDRFVRRAAALVALGRLRHPRAVEPLIRYLDRTGNPSAATVLMNIGDRRAVDALLRALRHPHPSTRFYAARALGKLGDERALPTLDWLRAHDATPQPFKTWRGKSVGDVAAKAIERIRSQHPADGEHEGRRVERTEWNG